MAFAKLVALTNGECLAMLRDTARRMSETQERVKDTELLRYTCDDYGIDNGGITAAQMLSLLEDYQYSDLLSIVTRNDGVIDLIAFAQPW